MNRNLARMLALLAAVIAVAVAAYAWLGVAMRPVRPVPEALRIGYAVEAPYAFVDDAGIVTGESPETARAIAARLGIANLEWVQTSFDALIPALETGRIDIIAAGMFITPARAKRVAFSEPTFRVQDGLLVRRGGPASPRSWADLAGASTLKVAVLAGSVEETQMTALGLGDARLVRVPDANTGRVAVLAGTAGALALSLPSLRWMQLRHGAAQTEVIAPAGQIAGGPPAFGYGGFAFRRDEARLLHRWNEAQRTYIGSAEHAAAVVRFGFGPTELPGTVTTAELTAP